MDILKTIRTPKRANSIMVDYYRFIILIQLFIFITLNCLAEPHQEQAAFKSAAALFNDGFYEQAENAFQDFIQKYPNSPHFPEAILFNAESKFKLKNFTNAIELLQTNLHKAHNLTDEYLFWIA